MRKSIIFINPVGLGHYSEYLALLPSLLKRGVRPSMVVTGDTLPKTALDSLASDHGENLKVYKGPGFRYSKDGKVDLLCTAWGASRAMEKNFKMALEVRKGVMGLGRPIGINFSSPEYISVSCLTSKTIWVTGGIGSMLSSPMRGGPLERGLMLAFKESLIGPSDVILNIANSAPKKGKRKVRGRDTYDLGHLIPMGKDGTRPPFDSFVLIYASVRSPKVSESKIERLALDMPHENFIAFGDFRSLGEGPDNLIKKQKCPPEEFNPYYEASKAYLGTAGSGLCIRCSSDGKPAYLVPLHEEQEMNTLACKGSVRLDDLTDYNGCIPASPTPSTGADWSEAPERAADIILRHL